jgi:hypothetical protein
MLGVGSRVTVTHPSPRFDGEPGRVVATHPPKSLAPSYFVVRVGGREIICNPAQVTETETEE